ncbi:DNA-binding domain-containing protein [Pseudomonas sp. C9]|uniref:DNA-binding domain-containing protein n=1 Tax=Pseudomonas sp. C9 TaxID=1311337 RepID=UPI0009865089|nr:DNA-binding domain-containing protein [Pseudomonas sp. C9]OOG14639.1 hypothetical protein BMS17_21890 [Pseudomonas sp. C9]
MTTTPSVGAQYTLDNQVYEVVSINDGLISMCSLIHQYRRHVNFDLFASMEQRGTLCLHQRAPIDMSEAAQWVSLPEEEQKLVRHRVDYLNACDKEFGGKLPKKAAKVFVAKLATRLGDPHPPSISTLWLWKKRYLASNRSPFALLKRYPTSKSKRTHHLAEELIKHYIKTAYLQRERPTVTHAYKLMVAHITYENKERRTYDAAPLRIPSYATFWRRIFAMDRHLVARARHGLKAAQRLNKFGGHLFVDDDPHANSQFDSQYMDVDVIDAYGDVAGRPILSAHLNPAHRKCPGWDISMGAPCAEKMMSATIRAIVNDGKMASITSDHGAEVFNIWSQTAMNRLGIALDYVPVGDPDAKAFIERFFGTVNTTFCHNLPGTTKGSPKARGDYPSEQRACLTLENLREAFGLWLEVYHNTWHDGLFTSPNKKQEELEKVAPPPERYSLEELQQLCLSVWRLRISGGRVKTKHLIWTGPGLPEVAQRLTASQKAIVYFNPCDLGTVWVAHPSTPKEWHPASPTHPTYQNGLTLTDHERLIQSFRDEKRAFDHTEAYQMLFELNEKIESFKRSAKNKRSPKSAVPPEDTPAPYPGAPHASDETNFPTHFVRDEGDSDEPDQ